MNCKLCGGSGEPFGELVVLSRHRAQYQRCRTCGYVAVENPHWLDEAYADRAIAALDTGIVMRNLWLADAVDALLRWRFRSVRTALDYDAVWVEKELFPWLPAWVETAILPVKTAVVVDYNDAVFHRYDRHRLPPVRWLLGCKIDGVMRRADLVTVGNGYLGARAQAAGAQRVEWLVGSNLPGFSRTYYEVPIRAPAASYRVSVFAFDFVQSARLESP